ncbi:MAG: hypothetical protein M3P30_09190 [Chloroflexota bacterium]|nr:hypothetical protein [Chloroflexota bacterium]
MGQFKLRNVAIHVLITIAIIAIVTSFFRGGSASGANSLAFSDVVQAGRDGKVDSIDVTGQSLSVRMKNDATVYHSRMAKDTDLPRVLIDSGVDLGGVTGVTVRYHGTGSVGIGGWLFAAAPILVIAVIMGIRMLALPLWKSSRSDDRTKPPAETIS